MEILAALQRLLKIKPNIESLKRKHDVEGLIGALNYSSGDSVADIRFKKTVATALGDLGDIRAIQPLEKVLSELDEHEKTFREIERIAPITAGGDKYQEYRNEHLEAIRFSRQEISQALETVRQRQHETLTHSKKTPEQPMSRSKTDEEKIIEIAQRIVPPALELSYYFICSGNQSLISAYHDLFRVGAPAYGGSATYYRADKSQLNARQADPVATSLQFAGQQLMGATVKDVSTVADVLTGLSAAGYGGVFISFVSVGPTGRNWVQKVYTTLRSDAVDQGILPFSMYTTANKDAAQFVLDSIS